jgi:hypothetical protein
MQGNGLILEFFGPFTLCGDKGDLLFDQKISQQTGVYLWTVRFRDGFLVNYVGETGTSFYRRMKDHMIQCLGGNYRICEPMLFSRGERKILWNGMWRKGTRDLMPLFVSKYVELAPRIKEYLELIQVFVAPIETTSRMRRRIEGTIAFSLREQLPPIGTFMNEDVRYLLRKKGEDPVRVMISCSQGVLGLRSEIIA